MAKTIFVGNLPWSVTDADLSQKFSEFGTVISARVVTDTLSGRSRALVVSDRRKRTHSASTHSGWLSPDGYSGERRPTADAQRVLRVVGSRGADSRRL